MKNVYQLQRAWSWRYYYFKFSKIVRTMKIILALFFLSVNVVFAIDSYAQQTKLSFELKNKRIIDVIDAIEKQSDFRFFYDGDLIDVEQPISIKADKKAVLAILADVFPTREVDYKVIGKDVILTSISPKRTKQTIANKQQAVSGQVVDEMGEPLPGVSVRLKNTKTGTLTDANGKYTLRLSDTEGVLIFSYLGFNSLEEAIGARAIINVTMRGEMRQMDEVVAVGYGTVKRANLGGAVSTVDSRTFESRPVRNAANALQGQVPGLTVVRNGGAPGSSPTLRIRDVSSINGGSPLVLIDGAEGDLGLINSADIENISVLKDGTAAIYGARAADGVILVTTKNGRKNQDLRISLQSYYSLKTPALVKKAASLYEHAAMALEIRDGSFPIEYTQDELQLILEGSDRVDPTSNWGRWTGYPKFYKNQDWNKLIIGNGNLQNYNLGISGGGDKYTYLISLGHAREEGLPKFGIDNDKRYYARAKSTIDLTKNLQYDFNLSYEANNRNYSSGISEGQNIWELTYKTRSWAPLRNPAGRFYTFEGFDNPAQVLEEGGESSLTGGNLTFNNQLTYKVTKDLNLVGRAVVRKNDVDSSIVQKMLYSYNWDNVNHRTARLPNSAERKYAKTLYKNFTLYGDYKKTIGKHDIGIMVGAASESANYDMFRARRINFDQQESMPLNLGSAQDQLASGQGNAWTINSFFSRINYAFNNKYLLEATLRADGSSRFDPNYRWGYFPGANATWRVAEEAFIKKLNFFNDLKLRASYGEMGNQSGIGPYDYIELISLYPGYYPFGNGQRGQLATQSNLVSKSRTWETIISKNIGMDFSMLRDRLYGSLDYFWKNNNNMLIPIAYPSALGIEAPTTNSGKLAIQGWELNIGWRDQMGDFSYSVRANISDAKNKVTQRIGNNLIGLGNNATPAGYPLNSYFGYVFDGIIQNEQELAAYRARFPNEGMIQTQVGVGDAKYKDMDGDGRLSELGNGSPGSGDLIYLGDANPRYNFGVNLFAAYKGFDFTAFIQGIGRRTMILEGEASMPFYFPWFQSAQYWYGKTWTPEHTDAQYPAITLTDKRYYNYNPSTNTTHRVGYARLKNVQIGYTFPKKLTQRIKLEKLRIYFSGEDLFEIHNTPGGWDPEDRGNIEGGGSYTSYPFARNYSLGLNLIF